MASSTRSPACSASIPQVRPLARVGHGALRRFGSKPCRAMITTEGPFNSPEIGAEFNGTCIVTPSICNSNCLLPNNTFHGEHVCFPFVGRDHSQVPSFPPRVRAARPCNPEDHARLGSTRVPRPPRLALARLALALSLDGTSLDAAPTFPFPWLAT